VMKLMRKPQIKDEKLFSFYKEHPKTCAPDDFWGQVKRTVNGQPVSEAQIEMIVKTICAGLSLKSDDRLLDLCCGNGALTDRIFDQCAGGLGIDFSEKLIEIAHKYFQSQPRKVYKLHDVVDYARAETKPDGFSKILCYGSFSFLEEKRAEDLLRGCFETFSNASIMFIGNYPDKARIKNFFTGTSYVPGVEKEPDSPIGIWRTKEEFEELAERAGWTATFSTMPNSFYASNYRFDVILRRPREVLNGIRSQ
jgi:cyclopropane fatty-acyl-phospholipid synthase-like methyltransferase